MEEGEVREMVGEGVNNITKVMKKIVFDMMPWWEWNKKEAQKFEYEPKRMETDIVVLELHKFCNIIWRECLYMI